MILVDLIRIEQVSKTISNLRLIPVDLKQLLQAKFMLALLINLLVSEFTFLTMLVLELMDGDFAFSSLAMLSWGLVYGAIAFAYTLSAGIIVLFLGKYRKELILAQMCIRDRYRSIRDAGAGVISFISDLCGA